MAAGLLWAITPTLEKLAIRHKYPTNPRWAALVVNGLLVILLSPVALRRGRAAWHGLAGRCAALLAAVFIAGIAPALGYSAVSLGLVDYVATLLRLSAVFTVIWGAWVLGEVGLARRLPAAFLITAGAVLIID